MRIFVTFENCYLVASRRFKRRATPFSRRSNPPPGQMRKNCVKKRYFGVKSDAARSFFISSREQQPLFEKKRREATGSSRKHGGVQVNFLVILEDHRSTIAYTYAYDGGANPRGRDLRILHIHRIFVNRRVPWREKKTGEEAIHPKKLKRGRLRRVRNG